jgi:uncharacterized protein
MIYVDTSVIVAALTIETTTERAVSWLIAQEAGTLLISPWVNTEFASALGLKWRQKTISTNDLIVATTSFQQLRREYCKVMSVDRNHFDLATEYLADYKLGLRSGDALHLAIASDNSATLCTLDQRLFDAGQALGIACVMP